jgi:LIM domain-binding protein 1
MSRHKAYALNPRDCLKTTLFQKWQKMVAPPGEQSFPLPFYTRSLVRQQEVRQRHVLCPLKSKN